MATTIQRMRETVQRASGINIVARLWLIIAPFVLGHQKIEAALWNDVVVGIVVAVLAVARVRRPQMNPGLSWIKALLGPWLIAAPFVLGYGGAALAEAVAAEAAVGAAQTAMWNDIIGGVIVLLLGAWSALSARGARGLSIPLGGGGQDAARAAPPLVSRATEAGVRFRSDRF